MHHSDTLSTLDSLLKDTLWYAAAASAVVGLSTGNADAQIVYTDVDPDVTVMDDAGWSTAGFDVDFDGDADPELFFTENPANSYTILRTEVTAGADAHTGILGAVIPYGTGFYAYPFPLSAGASIGPAATSLVTGYTIGTVTYASSDPHSFVGAGDVYIGVQFSLDGSTHWGWIRVEMPSNGQIIVKDYAYESTVDTAINAGDLPVAIEPGPDGLPGTHNLSAVYPNPFNPQARFTLEVAEQQNVSIAMFDALGRQVALLHEGTLSAGTIHEFQIDGAILPSGVYVVRAIGEQFTDVRQVTLTK